MKYVIVGGVAAGASAAARLRRLDEKAEIVILEKTGYISYANCGLPYFISGDISKKEKLTLQTPGSFFKRFNADVRVSSEVTAIDPAAKTVTVKNLADGSVYTESYDKLLLAPGARRRALELPGLEDERVFSLQTVEDALRLNEFIEAKAPRTAAIIGGGFVGLEMAECLSKRGMAVTMVLRSAQPMKSMDYDMACGILACLKKNGVTVLSEKPFRGVEPAETGLTVLAGEEKLAADLVLLAAGTEPNSALAEAAGLKLGVNKSILVDEHLCTSDPDIYAAGDAIQSPDPLTGAERVLPLAGPANRQGRIAADNMAGLDHPYTGSYSASIFKLFDMSFASTGLTETAAKAAGIPCFAAVAIPTSHASYYPGALALTLKGVFHRESGKLLGMQIYGFEGVDKRIDVAATAIRCGMTAAELSQLDLAYAPPYSAAKDPVNVIGSIADNVLSGKVEQVYWSDLALLRKQPDVQLLDVRMAKEVERGMIGGAIHIPLDQLRARLGELDPAKRYVVNCQSGLRSYIACRILSQHGFRCVNVSGGYGFVSAVMKQTPPDREEAFPCGVKPGDL